MPLRLSRSSRFLFGLATSLALVAGCSGGDQSSAGAARDGALPAPGDEPSRGGTNGTSDTGATDELGSRDGGTEATSPQPSGPPAVRFVGRFDARDPAGPTCAWPGCRIVARFQGPSPSLKARFQETVESWMEGGPSEWDVTIDGILQPKIVLAIGAHDYELATNLSAGVHTVELYKRSESQNGYTKFLGYDFGGGALLAPPVPAARRIEFVGDSGPAGFGIEGVGQGSDCPGPDWAARWQNFHKSMVARLGEITSADVHGTIYSGKGLAKNIWSTDTSTLPLLYPRSNPLDPSSAFDQSAFVPDVYVLMAGGNDFAMGQPVDQGPASLAAFTQATQDLVAMFRARSPQGHVFLAVSPSVSDAEPAGRNSRTNVKAGFDAVASDRASSGDLRVYSVAPPVAQASELTGCNGHGNPQYHDRVAQQLAVSIREKTGW